MPSHIQIDPDQRPAALAPPFTGHFRVILDTPRGLQSLHPGSRPSQHPSGQGPNGSAATATKRSSGPGPASLELRSSIYQTTSKSARQVSESEAATLANGTTSAGSNARPTNAVTYKCDTCGVDCTAVRYHSLKVKDFELCQPCYLDGRFPSTMFSGDFVRLTNAASVSGNQHSAANGGDAWSDQELLLLLEGVEMYDDDWSAIEEHVGTRSAQQCVRKFLELPIEDPYLESEGDMGAMRYARVPFEQADNPVMSVVAFLAGVVGPGVAAEAAKTALGELTKGEEKETKVPESDKEEKEKEKEGEKTAAVEGGEGEKKDNDDDKMDEDKVEGELSAQQPENAETSSSKPATPAPAGVEPTSSDAQPTSFAAEKPGPGVPHSKVVRAANLALKASAKAASSLASAEEANIRSTLAAVIKLQLTKLELKMSQFEELEDLLEEERRALEGARLALVSERLTLKKNLENVRAELSKHAQNQGAGGNMQGIVAAASQANMGTSSQGTRAQDVPMDGTAMEGNGGPLSGGNVVALS